MDRRFAIVVMASALIGSGAPRVLAPAQPGAWQVSRSATGARPVQMCVADIGALAQFEHRNDSCTRVVVDQAQGRAIVHYTCVNGNFGQAEMNLITPRTIRIRVQGISGGLPFDNTLHARRSGACARG